MQILTITILLAFSCIEKSSGKILVDLENQNVVQLQVQPLKEHNAHHNMAFGTTKESKGGEEGAQMHILGFGTTKESSGGEEGTQGMHILGFGTTKESKGGEEHKGNLAVMKETISDKSVQKHGKDNAHHNMAFGTTKESSGGEGGTQGMHILGFGTTKESSGGEEHKGNLAVMKESSAEGISGGNGLGDASITIPSQAPSKAQMKILGAEGGATHPIPFSMPIIVETKKSESSKCKQKKYKQGSGTEVLIDLLGGGLGSEDCDDDSLAGRKDGSFKFVKQGDGNDDDDHVPILGGRRDKFADTLDNDWDDDNNDGGESAGESGGEAAGESAGESAGDTAGESAGGSAGESGGGSESPTSGNHHKAKIGDIIHEPVDVAPSVSIISRVLIDLS